MKYRNTILINNKEYELFGEPLKSYNGFTINKPGAGEISVSPLTDEYSADWLLRGDQLYLCDFAGFDFKQKKNYDYPCFFGDRNIPFFAHWFCGEISVQDGEVIYTTFQKKDIKKYDFLMTFEKGKLKNTEMQDNTFRAGMLEILSRNTYILISV